MQDPHARSDVEQGLGLHLAVAHQARRGRRAVPRSPTPSVRPPQVLLGSDGPEVVIGGFAVARHRCEVRITPPDTARPSATGFPAIEEIADTGRQSAPTPTTASKTRNRDPDSARRVG